MSYTIKDEPTYNLIWFLFLLGVVPNPTAIIDQRPLKLHPNFMVTQYRLWHK